MSAPNYSNNVIELFELCVDTKTHLLSCRNMRCHDYYRKHCTAWYRDCNIEWLIHLRCTKCFETWCICYHCKKLSGGFYSKKQLTQHIYKHRTIIGKDLVTNDNKRKISTMYNTATEFNDGDMDIPEPTINASKSIDHDVEQITRDDDAMMEEQPCSDSLSNLHNQVRIVSFSKTIIRVSFCVFSQNYVY